MGFLQGSALTEAIQKTLSEGPVDLAVAYWGEGACDLLRLSADNGPFRVACDLWSGACNPSEIRSLLTLGAQISAVNRLHAKVYIGGAGMVVTSANASGNGLGEEGREVKIGLEAGYFTEEPQEIVAARAWFEEIITGSETVDADLNFRRLQVLWGRRRQDRPVRRAEDETFFALLQREDDPFAGRNLFVGIYDNSEEITEAEAEDIKSRIADYHTYDEADGPPFYVGFEGWGAETEMLIIDVPYVRKSYRCDGVWRVRQVIDKGRIIAAEKLKTPLGTPFTAKDSAAIAKAAEFLVRLEVIEADRKLIPASEFGAAVREHYW